MIFFSNFEWLDQAGWSSMPATLLFSRYATHTYPLIPQPSTRTQYLMSRFPC